MVYYFTTVIRSKANADYDCLISCRSQIPKYNPSIEEGALHFQIITKPIS